MDPIKDKKACQAILDEYSHRKEMETKTTKLDVTIENINKRVESQEKEIAGLDKKLDLVLLSLTHLENRINIPQLEQTHIEILMLLLNINACLENDSNINRDLLVYIQTEIDRVLIKYGYKIVNYSEVTKEYYEVEYQPITGDSKLVRRALVNNNNELIISGKIYLTTTNINN